MTKQPMDLCYRSVFPTNRPEHSGWRKAILVRKTLLKKFMAAGGQIHYTEDSKRWADLLAAFIGAILDTEHPYLLPPVGWYQLEDGRWLYTPQMKDTLATPLLATTDLEKLPLALVRILGIIKTRISDKF